MANLDDGELWLPSDIIPELGSPRRISGGPDVKSLAKQLAALGLLDPNVPEPAPDRRPDLAEEFGVGYRISAGTGAFVRGSAAVPRFNASRAVHGQAQRVDGRGGGAGRMFPARINGSGRARAGTGVFLPRVYYNNREVIGDKRKPDSVRKGEHQKQPVRKTIAAGGGKKKVTLMQAPAELTLPQEWTY